MVVRTEFVVLVHNYSIRQKKFAWAVTIMTRILAMHSSNLCEDINCYEAGFPHCMEANTRVVPLLGPWPISATSFPNFDSLIVQPFSAIRIALRLIPH
jgi:hypothetical protein